MCRRNTGIDSALLLGTCLIDPTPMWTVLNDDVVKKNILVYATKAYELQ